MTDKNVQNNESIWIKDKNNNLNKWDIYGETDRTYKVRASHGDRLITEVYKEKIHIGENCELYSTEIRNQISAIPRGYAKAEFYEFSNIF